MSSELPAPLYFVAAHAGAGTYPRETHSSVRKVLRAALSPVSSPSLSTVGALSIVLRVMSMLEAAEPLNAGYGSNLTLDGTVECDASLMDGTDGAFGSVGALSGVRSPAAAAHAVLEGRRGRAENQLGRVMPLLLAGEGARAFAEKAGVEICDPLALISSRASREWEYWKDKLQRAQNEEKGEVEGLRRALRVHQDTVGAVVLDGDRKMAAGVSSGGLLLREPGRVGEAAIFGAGCWADDRLSCSLTGQGELIMQSGTARAIAEAVEANPEEEDMHDILKREIVDKFYYGKLAGKSNPTSECYLFEGSPLEPKLVYGVPSRHRPWLSRTRVQTSRYQK